VVIIPVCGGREILLDLRAYDYAPGHLLDRRRSRFLNSSSGKEEAGFL
jgi:hypothetical protein